MHNKTLTELSHALHLRECSSVELTRYFLERIERYDAHLNSFISVTPEMALAKATAADERLAKNEAEPFYCPLRCNRRRKMSGCGHGHVG